MTKANLVPLYGAAFGFNTDRRIKPVHLATGFFMSLLGRNYRNELLNNVVAFADGKELHGNYALKALHAAMVASGKVGEDVSLRDLHTLRTHLRCLAANDEAVFPAYGGKAGFGCDYSTASHDILTRTRDNDGFAGHFVHAVLDRTADGQAVLEFARKCLSAPNPTWRRVLEPLLDDVQEEEETSERYNDKFGELTPKRLKGVAKRMSKQTQALGLLCRNSDMLAATETKLRFLVIGLSIWLFRYLIEEALQPDAASTVILADMMGDSNSRMRAQSRWSYARLRESLLGGFARFAQEGRFDNCAEAWAQIESEQQGRPKFEEFYRELSLRSGLAQPRASRVAAKHFEPQPDTLRVMVLAAVERDGGMVPYPELLERFFNVWGLIFGGRSEDAELLAGCGYVGLDQDNDLTSNAGALSDLLADLGLATQFSDGLVMCHSEPRFS